MREMLAWYINLMILVQVSSFLPTTRTLREPRRHARTTTTRTTPTTCSSLLSSNGNDNEKTTHPLSKTSRLSHVMLKVKSVDDAVAYWINTNGGKVTQSSRRNDKLQSAFVILGNGKQQQQDDDKDSSCFFALELVQTDNCQVGNVLNYIGVSMLLQFQKGNDFLQDLMAAKKETTTATASLPQQQQHDAEPHGIPVKSCASSPGDFLCRICLKSNNLVQTRAFYLNVLGMQVAAADESQLCLRYAALVDNSSRTVNDSIGVPTTLVFEGTNEKLDHGTCLDHLAIKTTTSIAEVFQRLQQQNRQESDDVTIYMTPTEMFGMTVMGLRDHNGYKIVLAGPA